MAAPIPLVPDVHETFPEVKDIQPLPKPADVESKTKVDEQNEPETKVLVEPEATTKTLSPTMSLEDFVGIERLSVTRKMKIKGVLAMKGKRNRFFVRTPDQSLVFTIEEENSSWWVGYFCYGLRPLQLRVINSLGTEVIRISRPYAFTTRILPCQLQRLTVYAPPGHLIGTIEQEWTAVKPLYNVRDSNGSDVFEVHGPRVTISCFQDVQFQILRPDGTLVASTNKRWQGIVHAMFFSPLTDTFGIHYIDKSMSNEDKALVLAAGLLLDYMYYDV